MIGHLYETLYFGGPCHGFVLIETHQREEGICSLSIGAAEPTATARRCHVHKVCQAVYKLSRTCHLIESGVPTIRYEYDFVGYERAEPLNQRVRTPWTASVRKVLSSWAHLHLWLPLPERDARNDLGRQAASCPAQVGVSRKNQPMRATPN
jgi:hypothetical protein